MSLDLNIYVKCEHCGTFQGESFNITHNLGDMAEAAGIYNCLWSPEESGYKNAKDIIPLLEKGLRDMKGNPGKYKKFDSDNGWGIYEDFVPWVDRVLECCKKYPEAELSANR